jgi:transposase-like protein
MALNGSGIRDTARVLEISPTTVISELKKSSLPGIGQPSSAGTLQSERYYC